jgi:hypothetical protein
MKRLGNINQQGVILANQGAVTTPSIRSRIVNYACGNRIQVHICKQLLEVLLI